MLITAAKYLMQVVPDSAATSITQALAAMTQKLPVTELQKAALDQATRFHYGDHQNVAFSWGSGRPVVFVHGWGGQAAQMAPLAAQVAKLGFRSVALDVTGHGESPKRYTAWSYFLRDIADLVRSLDQPVFALIGHSAGALSMMAARSLRGISAERYACICAPSEVDPEFRTSG